MGNLIPIKNYTSFYTLFLLYWWYFFFDKQTSGAFLIFGGCLQVKEIDLSDRNTSNPQLILAVVAIIVGVGTFLFSSVGIYRMKKDINNSLIALTIISFSQLSIGIFTMFSTKIWLAGSVLVVFASMFLGFFENILLIVVLKKADEIAHKIINNTNCETESVEILLN